MKSILVPTDFSACADKALEMAVAIAQKANVPLTLLHVTSQDVTASDRRSMGEEYSHAIDHEESQKLEALKQKMAGDVIINTHMAHGAVVSSILEAIKTFAADLVVMGTKGASGIRKVLMGSNAANVISKAGVPVLTIPAAYNHTGIKNIVLAMNSSEEDLHNLSVLFALANAFDAQVRLAIFSDENAEAVDYISDRRVILNIQNKLQSLYNKSGLDAEHLSGANFQDTLQAYLNDNHADMLAMITHKRGLIQGLFNRSMTREMAYHATLPLLSLHAHKA
ncbi:MAG: universal stress protein [Chitinophagaceae bacterium]